MDEARIVGVHEAAEILGFSTAAAVYDLIERGDFPEPLQTLKSGEHLWLAETVEEYARTREQPPPPDLAEFRARAKHMYGAEHNPLRLRKPGERLRKA